MRLVFDAAVPTLHRATVQEYIRTRGLFTVHEVHEVQMPTHPEGAAHVIKAAGFYDVLAIASTRMSTFGVANVRGWANAKLRSMAVTVHAPAYYMPTIYAPPSMLCAVVLHEWGHVLGLSHCDNPNCIMSVALDLPALLGRETEYCYHCQKKLVVEPEAVTVANRKENER